MRDEETQDGLKEITVRKDKHYSDKHYGNQMRKIARNQSVLCIEKTKTTKGIELIMIVEKNRRKEQIVSKTEQKCSKLRRDVKKTAWTCDEVNEIDNYLVRKSMKIS